RPAVAGRSTLHCGPHLVNRALVFRRNDAAVGPHLGAETARGIDQDLARPHESLLDGCAEGDARLLAFGLEFDHGGIVAWDDGSDALTRDPGVFRILLDADKPSPESAGDDAGRAGAEEWIEHEVTGLGRRHDAAVKECFGFLRRVGFFPLAVLEPLRTRAERDQPVAPHLELVIERFHRFVVEGVARALILGTPDEGLVRIGEATATEIRHWVRLAPDHVVQDPEAELLKDSTDAEDVVVAADHPKGAVVLEGAPYGREPGMGERVVGGEIVELVPCGVDAIDAAIVRPVKLAREL